MAQALRRPPRQFAGAAGEGVAVPRHGGAAEIQGAAGGVAHHLDHVGVEQLVCRGHRRGQRGHGGIRVGRQQCRHLAQAARRHERLVALEIDHHGLIRPAEQAHHLADALGTVAVVGAGQAHLGAESARGPGDAFVVGGDDHLAGTGLAGAAEDVLDEGTATHVGQGLARQPHRGMACRDHDAEAHLTSSSGARRRASSSSITGMSSRMG